MRVSDYIAARIADAGVRHIFLLSGGGMMHLLDAISRRTDLTYICNHHEQCSAFAADAYARKSGGLGVCFATSGPGATNTLTGIASSYQDSVPVLFVTGQSKVSQTIRGTKMAGLRQFGATEVDIVSLAEPITKWAYFLDDPKRVRWALEKAIHLAVSGRPGPTLLDVPLDIQGALIDPDQLEGFAPEPLPPPSFNGATMESILRRLLSAKRPLILAGHGIRCAGQVQQFSDFVRRLNIPVATSPLATDLLAYDHPLLVGHPSGKGDRPGNFAVQTADVILFLGCSLHVMTTGFELDRFAPQAHKIQIDIDERVLARERVGVQEKHSIGVGEFLAAADRILSQPIEGRTHPLPESGWHSRCRRWKSEFSVFSEPHVRPPDGINFYDLSRVLGEVTRGDETILADAGSAFYVIGQSYRVKGDQRVIICGALGQMGYALPAATGAALADPEADAICVTGDGSLQTNIHELATIRAYNLRAKVIVVNNSGYVSIRNTQNAYFNGNLAGTDKRNGVWLPSFERIANAFEIPYLSARRLSELPEVLSGTLRTAGPVLCEVFTVEDQKIIPTVSSIRLPDGRMQSRPLEDMAPFIEPARLTDILRFDE